eukprot:TRINITY_DN3433_c0_g1_i3.p1 TRINITY_DN3433_c0_g1~~TRINITY_DN3433_c0_g1_i3.p1  ORF type:complete len:297 (-),score=70.40 TRINITY_DN3433_c0_g1_i3:333-1202(-)
MAAARAELFTCARLRQHHPLGLLLRSTVRQTGRPYTSSTVASTASRRLARLEREADARSSDAVAQAAYLRELNAVSPEAVLRRVDRGRHAVGEPVAKEYIKALVATGRFDRARLPAVLQRAAGEVPASVGAAEAPPIGTALGGYDADRAVASSYGGVGPESSGFASGRVGGFGMASAAAPSMSSWSTNIMGAGGAGGVGGVGGAGGVAAVNPAVAAASAAGEPVNVRLAEPSMATQAWRTFRSLGTTFCSSPAWALSWKTAASAGVSASTPTCSPSRPRTAPRPSASRM